jgi:hypothetical protein
MGKTLPPFSQLIDQERHRWAPFRRALPKVDQVAFDRLFDCTKLHMQAGVYGKKRRFGMVSHNDLVDVHHTITHMKTRCGSRGPLPPHNAWIGAMVNPALCVRGSACTTIRAGLPGRNGALQRPFISW